MNDNASINDQVDEDNLSYQTVHSDDENEINNVIFKEGCINVGKNQIIIDTHNNDTEIKIIYILLLYYIYLKMKSKDLKSNYIKEI